jgi:hypothetical protein
VLSCPVVVLFCRILVVLWFSCGCLLSCGGLVVLLWLSCVVLSCLVLSCLALLCLALSCLVAVLPCLALPCLVLWWFCLVFVNAHAPLHVSYRSVLLALRIYDISYPNPLTLSLTQTPTPTPTLTPTMTLTLTLALTHLQGFEVFCRDEIPRVVNVWPAEPFLLLTHTKTVFQM